MRRGTKITRGPFRVEPLDKDQAIWVAARIVNDALILARVGELEKFKITPRQLSVLFMIDTLGQRATPAEIARGALRRPHTVSHMLSMLEKDGLIEKHADLPRANQVRIAFTEKGRKVYEKTLRRDSVKRVLGTLTEGEREQYRQVLAKLMLGAEKEFNFRLSKLALLNSTNGKWILTGKGS
jgi:DNA-binding MarR family transcriptional regulator